MVRIVFNKYHPARRNNLVLTLDDLLFELFETGIAVDPVPVAPVVVACTNK